MKSKVSSIIIRFYRIWVILAIVIVGAASYYGFILPQKKKYEHEVIVQEKKVEEAVDEKNIELIKLKSLIQGFNTITKYNIQSVVEILPEEKEKDNLFLVMSDLASEVGLYLKSISIGNGLSAQEYFGEETAFPLPIQIVPVQIQVAGTLIDYEKIKKILHLLYNRYRIVHIKSVDVSHLNQKTAEDAEKVYSLRIEVFMQE